MWKTIKHEPPFLIHFHMWSDGVKGVKSCVIWGVKVKLEEIKRNVIDMRRKGKD